MYNFSVFQQARKQNKHSSLPFLDASRDHLACEKPYQGLRILHNTPLTWATVWKIEALALGGAEVVVSSIRNLPPEKRAVDLLEKANFSVQLEHNFTETFDLHLDCCAELRCAPPPRIGCVELTQQGSKLYQSLPHDYPIISIDDSDLKTIETFYGTSNGFIRALQQLVNDDMHQKPYVLFGYGKVGKGIAHALQEFTNDITVIDILFSSKATTEGIKYLHIEEYDHIKAAISQAYCTITTTGVKNLITHHYGFHPQDFGSSLLINMGAEDEYGVHFSLQDVVFDKKPFNFSLEEPTLLKYLDPVFYAHNLCVDLLLSEHLPSGYHAFPASIAKKILHEWQSIHQENIPDKLFSL